MKQQLNKKGETLIEVIAALTSLVLAGIAAMTLIISVMSSTAISKEYLVAQNLAREGIEGVTNIRDTNWLLFPSGKTDCWMVIDSSACPDTGPSIGADYLLIKAPEGNFELDGSKGQWNDDMNNNQNFKIELNTAGIYEQSSVSPAPTQPFPTFYRKIEFEKVESADLADTFDKERMKIIVTVAWMNKSTITKYELSSILANYEK